MPLHHVIPRHEWKKRFGSLEGCNSSDNLVVLTTEQHAQAHQILWDLNGSEYDRLAALRIGGAIGHDEAIRQAQSHSNRTRVITDAHRKNQSLAMKGRKHTLEHNQKIKKACAKIHQGDDNPMSKKSIERRNHDLSHLK